MWHPYYWPSDPRTPWSGTSVWMGREWRLVDRRERWLAAGPLMTSRRGLLVVQNVGRLSRVESVMCKRSSLLYMLICPAGQDIKEHNKPLESAGPRPPSVAPPRIPSLTWTCGGIFSLCTNQGSTDQKFMPPLLASEPRRATFWFVDVSSNMTASWLHTQLNSEQFSFPAKFHIYLIDDRTAHPPEDVQVHVVWNIQNRIHS